MRSQRLEARDAEEARDREGSEEAQKEGLCTRRQAEAGKDA